MRATNCYKYCLKWREFLNNLRNVPFGSRLSFLYISSAWYSSWTFCGKKDKIKILKQFSLSNGTIVSPFSSGWTRDEKITIKTPNPRCRLHWCLTEFMDWRDSQSCWYFLVNHCHSLYNVYLSFDQIPNLHNGFTTPNKNLGGEGASDRKHLPRKSLYRSIF
jgi:hypothetical protein